MLNQSNSYNLNKSLLMQKPKNLTISTYNYNQSNKVKKISLSRPLTNASKFEISQKYLIPSNFEKKNNEDNDILFPSPIEKLNLNFSFKKLNTILNKQEILKLVGDLSNKNRKTKSIIKIQNLNEFSSINNQLKSHFFNTNSKSVKWKILQGSTNSEQYRNLLLPEINNEQNSSQNSTIKVNKATNNSSKKNISDFSFGGSEKSLEISKTTNSIDYKKDMKSKNTICSSSDKYKSQKKRNNIDLFKSKKIKTINKNLVILNKLQHGNLINIETNRKKQESPSILELKFPDYPSVKYSSKKINEYIECYAVNTYKGLVKTTNENKISIILSVGKPKDTIDYWPKTSFLAIYDGKFGTKCSNFLRDKLHNYIIKDNLFPKNPKGAILNGFKKVESEFLKIVKDTDDDNCGSCAIICLILDNKIYIANCGDSKAFLSINHIQKIKILNKCHSLENNPTERERIINSGLKIITSKNGKEKIIPGKLKITRGIGFANLKFQGGENGILGIPQIKEVKIDENFDFLIILSGGVVTNCHSKEIIDAIYNVIKKQKKLHLNSVNELAGACVDIILKTSLVKGTLENVSCIFVGFKNFNKLFRSNNNIGEYSSKEMINNKKRKSVLRFLFSNKDNDSVHKKITKSVKSKEENIANTARNIRPKKEIRLISNEVKINLKRKINIEVNNYNNRGDSK